MNIPVSILLIPYALFVLFFLFYGAFNLYHLVRFAVPSVRLYMLMTVFLCGGAALLMASILALTNFDWSSTLAFGSEELFEPYARP